MWNVRRGAQLTLNALAKPRLPQRVELIGLSENIYQAMAYDG